MRNVSVSLVYFLPVNFHNPDLSHPARSDLAILDPPLLTAGESGLFRRRQQDLSSGGALRADAPQRSALHVLPSRIHQGVCACLCVPVCLWMAERVPAGLVGGLNSIGSCVIVFFYFEFAASTLAVSLGRAGSALIRPGQVTPCFPSSTIGSSNSSCPTCPTRNPNSNRNPTLTLSLSITRPGLLLPRQQPLAATVYSQLTLNLTLTITRPGLLLPRQQPLAAAVYARLERAVVHGGAGAGAAGAQPGHGPTRGPTGGSTGLIARSRRGRAV